MLVTNVISEITIELFLVLITKPTAIKMCFVSLKKIHLYPGLYVIHADACQF